MTLEIQPYDRRIHPSSKNRLLTSGPCTAVTTVMSAIRAPQLLGRFGSRVKSAAKYALLLATYLTDCQDYVQQSVRSIVRG